MRTRPKGRRNTRARVFAALLVCSLVGLLLPRSLTGGLMNLLQILVPLQDTANRAVDAVSGTVVGRPASRVSAAEWENAQARQQALQHTVVTLQSTIAALEQSNRELAAIRGRGMPGKLIPARVVAPDVSAWRRSQLIDAGSLRSVRNDAAVISNYFTAHLGTEDGARTGLAVLSGEVLIGTIETAGTHTSRVKLLSDPTTRMAVLIARTQGDQFLPLDAEFWLVGAGENQARVRDVDHRYVKSGEIREGDGVLTVHGDPRLPVSMMVGTVRSAGPDRDNPLLYVLEVELAIDPARLRRVYVVDPSGQ